MGSDRGQGPGQACLNFRADISATFRRGFPRSVFAYCGMLAADLLVLVLCLRFVGVGPQEASLADIAIAYAFAYPFTLFPFSGLGVVDAVILASLVSTCDTALEAAVVAGLIVWRVFTVLVPVLLGALAVATWRRTLPTPATHRAAPDRSGPTTPPVHRAKCVRVVPAQRRDAVAATAWREVAGCRRALIR